MNSNSNVEEIKPTISENLSTGAPAVATTETPTPTPIVEEVDTVNKSATSSPTSVSDAGKFFFLIIRIKFRIFCNNIFNFF